MTAILRKSALLIGMGWLAIYFAAVPVLAPLTHGGYPRAYWTYTAAQAQLNWLTTGFARRELYNTIVGLMGVEPLLSTALVFVASYALLAVAMIWAVARRPLSFQSLAVACVCLAVLYRLAADVGRSDAAVMICGLGVVYAARSGRWALASIALCVAWLIHESGLAFFLPAALAIAWEQRRAISKSSAIASAVILALGAALFTFGSFARPDVPALAIRIHAAFLDPTFADVAVYFNLSGSRGFQTAACEIRLNPHYWVQVGAGAILLTLAALGLTGDRWKSALLTALVPFAALSAVAFDVGRWGVFGVFSIAVCALSQPETRAKWLTLAAFVVPPLMVVALSAQGVFTPIPLADKIATDLDHRSFSLLDTMRQCDPTWQSFAGIGK